MVTTEPPDKHVVRGSYGGKDVMPLYRDGRAEQANLPRGLTTTLGKVYGREVSPSDVAAYVFAMLAHPAYYETFQTERGSPGLRVPFTRDAHLFAEALELGYRLLWLQTSGQRYADKVGETRLPSIPGLGWTAAVTDIPEDATSITYDAHTRTLHVGRGAISGVLPEVWAFKVSGYQVLPKWLGRRTSKGTGRSANPRSATPLDRIRPGDWSDEWNDELLTLLRSLTATVGEFPVLAKLLAKVIAGDLISPSELPTPTRLERAVPNA